MFTSDNFKNAKVDEAFAAGVNWNRGYEVHEGSCSSAGFNDKVWHNDKKGIKVSVWKH